MRRFTKHVPIAPRCGLATGPPCRHHAPPELIGYSDAHEVIQPIYQCPVCHAVLTEYQAFRS